MNAQDYYKVLLSNKQQLDNHFVGHNWINNSCMYMYVENMKGVCIRSEI